MKYFTKELEEKKGIKWYIKVQVKLVSSTLLFDQKLLNKRKARMYYCNYCLHGFIREDLLDEHIPNCQPHGAQKVSFPKDDKVDLKF